MRMRSLGWFAGSLGLLVGAGSARAEDQPMSGRDAVNQMEGKPECRDAGVTVSFTTGSVDLDTNAHGALNGVATWMKADSKRSLHLHGYADTTGNSEANLVLSQKRADAVKDYLVAQGVDASQIMTVGRGEDVADQLPANGRTVTFLACKPPAPTAEAETPRGWHERPRRQRPKKRPRRRWRPWCLRWSSRCRCRWSADDRPPTEVRRRRIEVRPRVHGGRRLPGLRQQQHERSDQRGRRLGRPVHRRDAVGHRFRGRVCRLGPRHPGAGGDRQQPEPDLQRLEGNLRLNVPIIRGDSLVEPYIVGGVGWSQYHIANYNSNTQALSDFSATNDNVMTVPLGVGFAYGYKALHAGRARDLLADLLQQPAPGDQQLRHPEHLGRRWPGRLRVLETSTSWLRRGPRPWGVGRGRLPAPVHACPRRDQKGPALATIPISTVSPKTITAKAT